MNPSPGGGQRLPVGGWRPACGLASWGQAASSQGWALVLPPTPAPPALSVAARWQLGGRGTGVVTLGTPVPRLRAVGSWAGGPGACSLHTLVPLTTESAHRDRASPAALGCSGRVGTVVLLVRAGWGVGVPWGSRLGSAGALGEPRAVRRVALFSSGLRVLETEAQGPSPEVPLLRSLGWRLGPAATTRPSLTLFLPPSCILVLPMRPWASVGTGSGSQPAPSTRRLCRERTWLLVTGRRWTPTACLSPWHWGVARGEQPGGGSQRGL